MPMALKTRVIPLITSINVPWDSVNPAKIFSIEICELPTTCGVPFFVSISTLGKRRKVTIMETIMPPVIIQPKVITGKMSQESSDPNPAIVVSAAYRHGVNFSRTVSRTSFF